MNRNFKVFYSLLFLFIAALFGIAINVTNMARVTMRDIGGTNYFWVVVRSNGVPVDRTITFADFQQIMGTNFSITGNSTIGGSPTLVNSLLLGVNSEWKIVVENGNIFHFYSAVADENLLTFNNGNIIISTNPQFPTMDANTVTYLDSGKYLRSTAVTLSDLNRLNGSQQLYGTISASGSIFLVDLSSITNAFISTAAISGNVSLRFTNLVAGRWVNLSILGPAGSNQVSYIWEPWVRVRWPVDQFTDLAVTNDYVRTNCYLELSIQAYKTNEVRAAGRMFK